MSVTSKTRSRITPCSAAFIAGLLFLAPGRAVAQRQFKSKDCMECHTKFAEKADQLKYQH